MIPFLSPAPPHNFLSCWMWVQQQRAQGRRRRPPLPWWISQKTSNLTAYFDDENANEGLSQQKMVRGQRFTMKSAAVSRDFRQIAESIQAVTNKKVAAMLIKPLKSLRAVMNRSTYIIDKLNTPWLPPVRNRLSQSWLWRPGPHRSFAALLLQA